MFLITSDWHIRQGDAIWKDRSRDIYGDVAYSLKQICEIAKQQDDLIVILAGDIFDTRQLSSDMIRLIRQTINELNENAREIWFVQGQHEYSNEPLLCSLFDNILHIHEKKNKYDSLIFYGLDYVPSRIRQDVLSSLPDADILITHQQWANFLNIEDYPSVDILPESYRLIITGDHHKHTIINCNQRRVVSPGAIVPNTLAEQAPFGVWLMDSNLCIKSVPIKTRNIYTIQIITEEELNNFLNNIEKCPALIPQENVPENIQKNILRVVYSANLSNLQSRIFEAIGDLVHLFFSPILISENKEEEILFNNIRADRSDFISGLINTIIDNKEKKWLIPYISELLFNSDEPARLKEAVNRVVENISTQVGE